ncbi:MAG: hypothetical protein HYW27_00870 [Candidatus Aenigmarchaeota archaeon]|nr:hypothetical protein [Candidatus Aenigmarchaeota archaeon]
MKEFFNVISHGRRNARHRRKGGETFRHRAAADAGECRKERGVLRDNLKKWTKWHIGTLKSMYVDVLYPTNQFAFADTFKKCDVIIDALVGYGINRPPSGFYESLIKMANESGKKILSIDMPTGMNPDTGGPYGACMKAKWTLSVGMPKKGLLEKKAKDFTGMLYLCDIGIPPEVYELLQIKYENPFDRNEIVKL